MSVYDSWYISKARKFEVKATRTEKGTILMDLNVYDGLKVDASPEQWDRIIKAVEGAMTSTTSQPRTNRTPPASPPPATDEDY